MVGLVQQREGPPNVKRSTIYIGGAAAAAALAFLWWRSRTLKEPTPAEIIRSGPGGPVALKPTAGIKAVAIAGGTGAGAGKPLDTKTAVKPRRVTTVKVNRKRTA
jgi:hypothetical protein